MEAARLRSRNIRPREIFTREKQWHAGNLREGAFVCPSVIGSYPYSPGKIG